MKRRKRTGNPATGTADGPASSVSPPLPERHLPKVDEPRRRTRALVFHPYLKDGRHGPPPGGRAAPARLPEARLAEAVSLAAAIDLEVVETALAPLSDIRPATYIGSGKVEELAALVKERGIELIVADCDLSPGQQRNLERALNAKVIDRTGLILEIFGERAQTKEGRLQVELAHLTYQKSRLVRSWTHLERQRGGFGFLGGPGETQIEVDRRLIGERIAKIKTMLQAVTKTRGLHRRARQRVPYPVVALVGYTNTGKSTLFNRLTAAEVLAADMLFATLDPTMRAIALPSGRRVILSDTVGFISHLPTHLVAAFRATLEEVIEADLILHVRDIAHPETEAQKADVLAVLGDLGVTDDPARGLLEAWNKIDLLPPEEAAELVGRSAGSAAAVAISAITGAGIDALRQRIDAFFAARDRLRTLRLNAGEGAAIAWLYAHGEVVSREDGDDAVDLTVRMTPAAWSRFLKAYSQATFVQAAAAQ
ncbi:MAG: GTPase HflX [Sphingomonadales bacterium]|nr:GTPase HflX [Sphingomonadales bacterium]